MTGKSALVLGATGATGKFLLQELLNSPAYSRVGEYGRRVTALEAITTGKDKLEQKAIDFEKLGESGLKDGKWDVVFITLGTRRANVSSAAEFEKIDREYVINAAREAKTDDPSVDQRLIYVSSAGANKDSWFLYPKSKGLTEDGLSKLGYKETLIFRPGALTEGKRSDHRLAESILINTLNLRTSWTNDYTIECPILGRALKNAGALSLPALEKFSVKDAGFPFTLFNNPPLRALAEESV